MSNQSSLTLDEVKGGVVEEILQERADEAGKEMAGEENQENALEVVPEEIEVVVEKLEPYTPTNEQKCSRSIWQRRAL